MTIYYISGSMRGKPDYNRAEFNAVEDDLRQWIFDRDVSGNVADETRIINPSKNFNGNQSLNPVEYMNLDLQQVLESDVIVQLPDWRTSEGAMREALLALWTGKRFMQAEVNDGDAFTFTEIHAPEFSVSPRASVLDEAKQLITGDRNNAYGPP